MDTPEKHWMMQMARSVPFWRITVARELVIATFRAAALDFAVPDNQFRALAVIAAKAIIELDRRVDAEADLEGAAR